MSASTHVQQPAWWAIAPKQPFLRRPLLVVWYLFLLAGLGIGAMGIYDRLTLGLQVTDLTSQVPWGAWVVFYVYFVGLSAGSTMLSSLVYAFKIKELEDIGRPTLTIAIISLGIGLAFIGMDLGNLIKSPNAMFYFHWTSPLSWAVRAYVVYLVLLIAQLVIAVLVQRGFYRNVEAIAWWQRLLSAITLPLAIIGVLGAEGSLFAVVKVRGMWAGGLFPVIFLASAIVAATALIVFVHYVQRKGAGQPVNTEVMRWLSRMLLAALLIDAGLTAYEYGIPLLSQNHHEMQIIDIVMRGPYAWTFWVLQVAMGLLIPIILLLFKGVRDSAGIVAGLGAMILVGMIGVRFNIVLPPQIAPIIEGYPLNDYFPTWTEWSSSIFLIAAGATAYTLACQWQPIHDPTSLAWVRDEQGVAHPVDSEVVHTAANAAGHNADDAPTQDAPTQDAPTQDQAQDSKDAS